MGFSGYPVTTSTPITYDLVIQLWQAWWRRKIATGQIYWPPPDAAFPGGTDNGTVAAISLGTPNLTVTCNRTQSWGVAANNACGTKRWVNYVCEPCNLSIMPTSYDLIVMVDFFEPRTHVRMPILDQVDPTTENGTGQLVVDPTAAHNAVTAGYISSVSDLNGKEYYIQKRNGAWITDRWPERPDDQQHWQGSGTASTGYFGDDTTTLYRTLTEASPSKPWGVDQWAGKQLMVFSGSLLKRLAILHNDEDTLYVVNDSTSAGIGGTFSVVDVGAKCTPGRPLWHYSAWLAGASDVEAGHLLDDSLGTVAVPKRSVQYFSGDPCTTGSCGEFPRTEQLFDAYGNQKDYQIDWQDICAGSQAGNFVNRSVWKSFRMLQTDIEASCMNFLPVLGEGGSDEGKETINTYTPATFFRDMGSPSSTTTTQFETTSTDGEGNEYGFYYFNVGSEFVGEAVRYTILDAKGKTLTYGVKTSDTSGKIGNVIDNPFGGKDTTKIGLQVIYALPWLRVRPRWVRTLYDKTCFVPATGEEGPIDPPVPFVNDDGGHDCSAVGNWITQPESAGGFVCASGIISDGEPFVVGGLYRYVGHNYRDPFPGGPTTGASAVLNPYWDRFYQGRLSKPNQGARDASRTGTVTSGTKYSLTQADSNWWSDWANGGTLRTESGTVTSGGSTSITDNTKDTTNNQLPHSCWWKNDAARYTNTATAYEDFILEVTHAGTVYKLPILSTSNGSGGVTVNFASVGVTFTAGDTYRIREPRYELNKWKGRTLNVTAEDGTPVLVNEPILYSDDTTLFFAAKSQPIPAGARFEIVEKQPGVYRWTGTEFVLASGADAARVTVQTPTDFLPDSNANNNGWVKDYGVIEYGDLLHVGVLNQLHAAITLLYDTQAPLTWTNKASPTAAAEKNTRAAGAQLPYWTEEPTHWQYLVDQRNYYNPETPMNNIAYNSHDGAWKRAWAAVYDWQDQYHALSEAEYEDYMNGGDGTVANDGMSPRQFGSYQNPYCYVDHWEYPGYYYAGCNHAIYTDGGAVLYGGISVQSAEAYGKVNPLPGFRKLSATINGLVYAAINPADPDESDYDSIPTHDFCVSSRWTVASAQFQPVGSGALFRKWHVYNSWSVAAGTTTAVHGPKYGSKNFIDEPDVKKFKCRSQTCTNPFDGTTYTAFNEIDEYGSGMGWCVIAEFARVSWNMEGF